MKNDLNLSRREARAGITGRKEKAPNSKASILKRSGMRNGYSFSIKFGGYWVS